MRVAITGATGNIGTSLVERLADDDTISEIIGVARRRPDWSPAKTRWVQADIAVDDLTAAFRDVDAVVHLAWAFHPTHNPLATWENNAMGSERVFRAAAAASARTLVSASSVGAYSPAASESRVDESWPTHALPTAAYGREKSYVERLLDVFERDHPDIRVVRLRPGFIFKRSSAQEQRRIFAGPLLPNRLVRPEAIPVVPDLPGLRFQTLHSRDAAQAYHLALTRDVSGAFNVAADPIVDVHALAELLGARVVRMPLRVARAAVSAAWHLHLLPASPHLLDLFLSVPVMDTTRATTELGWTPTMDSLSVIREVMEGMREGAGGQTPPLDPDAGGALREKEIATGVGERGGVTGDGR
jgi:nucleoside-diphosphate-sugar epimerase